MIIRFLTFQKSVLEWKKKQQQKEKKKGQQPNTRNVIWEDVKLMAGRSAGAGTRRLPANK